MGNKNVIFTESQLKEVIGSIIIEKESSKIKIKEQRVGRGIRSNRAALGNGGTSAKPTQQSVTVGSEGPGKTKSIIVSRPTTLTAGLFANGVNTINVNSNEFKGAVTAIQNAVKSSANLGGDILTVTVEGGASAVGSSTGYDNKTLATSRANNFIKSIAPQFKNVKFVVGPPKVGVNTVKNSAGAQAEQYVKLNYSTKVSETQSMPAVDNARQRKTYMDTPTMGTVKKTINIPSNALADVEAYIKKLGGSLL